jgi:uncharacterized protein
MTASNALQPLLLIVMLSPVTAVDPPTESEKPAVTHTNRLSQESSPYLLMHAHNPVDWYPWGPEALEKAKTENKPIFLSIGYSSCYWCHVMERQVFTNVPIAKYMNEHFVNIKVDREERPDIDDIYMTSLIVYKQASGQPGGGGWPLSMFLTPDGDPIAGATYLPPADTPDGRTGFPTIAKRVHELWGSRQKELAAQAAVIATEVRRLSGPKLVSEDTPLQGQMVERAVDAVRSMYDPVWGGVDFRKNRPDGPRFPSVPRLNLLLSVVQQDSDQELMKILNHSLNAMAHGGIRDHLGGGFHRYSTDRRWHVPHFEKMLYDQAMLLHIYAQMAAMTGDQTFDQVVRGISDFVRREMTLPDGGFCSALDAETNAIEGEYYVWQPDNVKAILGPADADMFLKTYGMLTPSHFEHGYVLHLPRSLDKLAADFEISTDELNLRLKRMRVKLLAVRNQRPRPLLDDKVLTEWNAMMIQALAVSGTLPGHEQDLELATNAADFLLNNLQTEDGHLLRSWRNGQTSGAAYLDDYAFLVAALIELHEATNDERWLNAADTLMAKQIELFHDKELGTFFFTAHDHEKLLARTSTVFDSVSESGNSVTIRNLLTLSHLKKNDGYAKIAQQVLQRYGKTLHDTPAACAGLAVALQEWLSTQPHAAVNSGPTDYLLTSLPRTNSAQQQPAGSAGSTDTPATQENSVFKPIFPDPSQSSAFSKRDEERPIKAKIYPLFDKLERGGKCPVAIVLTVGEKWHINANPSNPDFLVPTAVQIACKQKIKMTRVKYPKHELMIVPGAETPYHVYGKKVVIYCLLEIDADETAQKAEIEVHIKYQACNEKECLPPDEIVMKGKLSLANAGDDIKRINEDKFPKPKKDGTDKSKPTGTDPSDK